MKTQTIRKSVDINAPKERVWEVLLQDEYTRIWYAAFSEGTHAETDWKVGSKAVFTDDSKSGLVSKVIANNPGELLSLEHEGIVTDGKEDYDSDIAKQVKGGREIYRLSEKDGITQVSIESDMDESFFDSMSVSWDKATAKIKELSEKP